MSSRSRYSRWDGTQNLDEPDPDDVLDARSDDLMSYGDLSAALQRLYRWGAGDMPGLEQLLRQLRERRERELSRYDLDSTVESIREQLQDVIDTERVGIDRKVDEAPQERRKLMERLDTSASFRDFMQKYGHLFPPGIETLDQLLEHLQRQMAQMQSLMQSLSPQARDELRRMMDELLQDDSLRLELARLGAMMQQLMPPSELTERYPFFGDEPLSLQEAMGLMGRLQGMDRLESQLERGSFRLDDVDRGLLEQTLGPEARRQLDRMRQMTEMLAKAG